MSDKTGGPAYPVFPDTTTGHAAAVTGMTLIDKFAGDALTALINKLNFDGLYREQFKGDSIHVAHAAYTIAAAMIEARKEYMK